MSLLVSHRDQFWDPVLFNLYVNDLSDGLKEVTSYQYADNTLLYKQGRPTELVHCKNQLRSWLRSEKLRLATQSVHIPLTQVRKLNFTLMQMTAEVLALCNYVITEKLNTMNPQW